VRKGGGWSWLRMLSLILILEVNNSSLVYRPYFVECRELKEKITNDGQK
jgi:hypothetical protein